MIKFQNSFWMEQFQSLAGIFISPFLFVLLQYANQRIAILFVETVEQVRSTNQVIQLEFFGWLIFLFSIYFLFCSDGQEVRSPVFVSFPGTSSPWSVMSSLSPRFWRRIWRSTALVWSSPVISIPPLESPGTFLFLHYSCSRCPDCV